MYIFLKMLYPYMYPKFLWLAYRPCPYWCPYLGIIAYNQIGLCDLHISFFNFSRFHIQISQNSQEFFFVGGRGGRLTRITKKQGEEGDRETQKDYKEARHSSSVFQYILYILLRVIFCLSIHLIFQYCILEKDIPNAWQLSILLHHKLDESKKMQVPQL